MLEVWPVTPVETPQLSKSGPTAQATHTKRVEAKSTVSDPEGAAENVTPPTLDVARIDPKGTSVFAGRAEPNSQVTVLASDKVIGVATADKFGEWALVAEKPVPTDASQIVLRAKRHEDASGSNGPSVKITLPKAPREKPDRLASVNSETPNQVSATERKAKTDKTANAVTSRLMKQMKELVKAAKKQVEGGAASPPVTFSAENDTETAPPIKNKPGQEQYAKTMLVPIKFVYRETTFTPEGVEAAQLLLNYVKLKAFNSITLSGHADERGTEPHNLDLSRRRLEAVSHYLKVRGFEGEIVVVPKGETVPYLGVDRRNYSQQELWQLDRRVELHIEE